MMQNTKFNAVNRVMSIVLSVVMIVSLMPLSVFAVTATDGPGIITSDIAEKEFIVGQPTEFTYTTVANDDLYVMVKGTSTFSDPSAIETLEYWENHGTPDTADDEWLPLTGDFGPSTGFPMSDATSKFRVTFKKAGIYTATGKMVRVDNGEELCSTTSTVSVSGSGSSLTTNIESVVFTVGQYSEFTFTTNATTDANALVRGYFEFSDQNALESLQYYNVNTSAFEEFYGDFGPATGFPMTDGATSRFQAKFITPGTYTVKAYMQDMDGNILCVRVADVVAKKNSSISYTETSIEVKYTDTNNCNTSLVNDVHDAEWTYSSDNTSVVMVSDTGILTPKGVGDATITVTRKESATAFASTTSYNVKVVPGEQDALVWANTVPSSIAWTDSFTNTVTGGSVESAATYSSSDETVADVDAVTGKVTFKKPGTVKITATKAANELFEEVTSEYTLVAVKADTSIAFADSNPDAITYGDNTFVNKATGGYDDTAVTYKSSDTTIAEVDADGKITPKKQGTVTITASLAGNDLYNAAADVSYKITVNPADQTALSFGKGESDQTIAYGEAYENVATGGNTEIKYTSSNTDVATVNETTGAITTLKAGETTITATAAASEQYNEIKLSYKLIVELAEQTVVFENGTTEIPAIIFGQEYKNAATAKTTVTYESNDETVAKVNADGTLEIFKSGTVTITATAEKTAQYKESSASYEITVNKAGQLVSFANGPTPEIAFNDNENAYANAASSVSEITGEPTGIIPGYYIVEGDSLVSDFNLDDGSFKILGTGVVKIKVLYDSNDCFENAGSVYTLTIKRDDQTIAFASPSIEVTNGDNSYTAYVLTNTGAADATGAVTYSLKENSDGVADSINATTGAITFTGKVGEVTVLATKAQCANYNEATAEYTLTVTDWKLEESTVYYTLTGDKVNNSKWFTGNVSVTAEDGYLVSYDALVATADWKASLADAVTDDTVGTDISFYIQHEEKGYISAKQTVTVYKDTVAPDAKVEHEGVTSWTEKLLSIITLGLWPVENTEMSFTIASSDADPASGVDKVEYLVVEGSDTVLGKTELDAVEATEWTKYEGAVKVAKDKLFVVYAKVTDAAGHYVYATTNGVVFDRTESTITLTPEETDLYHGELPLYKGDVDVEIKVDELVADSYSGIKTVDYWVICDGKSEPTQEGNLFTFDKTNPTYDELVNSFTETVTIEAAKNNSCDVELFVKVVDNAGNVKENSVKVDIDVTAPIITVTYDNNTALNDKYFAANRTATIVITERAEHFDADAATEGIVITAKNAKNEDVTIDLGAMISGWAPAQDADDHEKDTHTATIAYTTDANYTFEINYTDLATNVCTDDEVDYGTSVAPEEFTVDKVKPVGTVTVDVNTWDKLLNVLTFKLWKNETVSVSATADDETSPFVVTYYKAFNTDDAVIIKTAEELDNIPANQWTTYAPFEVDSDEKFVVYLKVKDHADNYEYFCSDGFVVDKTQSSITLTPDAHVALHNNIKVYNSDVKVKIEVKELVDNAYSGIKKVEYWVKCDGNETQRETLYDFDKEFSDKTNLTYAQLKRTFTETVTIQSAKNNSCDVKLHVGVTDNAGNYKEEVLAVDIDITAPTINVSYDNNIDYKIIGNKGYYSAPRYAYITITERTAHFNASNATNGISVTATDASGKSVITNSTSLVSSWSTSGTGDNAIHTTVVDFSADANYTFGISYTDLATNRNTTVSTGSSVTPYEFAVDTTAPTGTVTAGKLGTWDKLIEILTFGLWTKDSVEVTATYDDVTTEIESVSYYKTSDKTAKKASDLDAVTSWQLFNGLTVDADETFVVYLRIVDYAGNVAYISTNGIIVDDSLPEVETVKPEVTITPEPSDGVYNSDVTFAVNVVDPKTGDTNAYAGLKEIRYEVYNMGVKTQEGTLYSFDESDPVHGQLLQSWSKKDAIVADKTKNNSNDVKVVVYAVDNAGNEGKAECNVKIDITAPAISVSYDNNNGDTTFAEGVYFDANRTATIVVTDRNFDPDKVDLVITNTDGYIPEIGTWYKTEGTGNGDDTIHTAQVVFDRDGDYTFAVSCTDMAGNASDGVDFGDSQTPEKFTVDKTAPVVNVFFNNNEVMNEKYYKAERVATITVTEHNFYEGRAIFILEADSATDYTAVPKISNWHSNGNVHTATVTFTDDAVYLFGFQYSDKAGNAANGIANQQFVVDTTVPEVKISGIVDESANNNEGNIGFKITSTDINFDIFTPVLTAVIKNGDKFETKTLDIAKVEDIENGKTYTVTNIADDGIYRITCTVVDLAGNEFTSVILDTADGATETVERSGSDTLVTFSVNRNGSTFEIDEETVKVTEQYYIKNLENNIVVVEINVDPLKKYTITLNGKELAEDSDYTVAEEGGNGAWMKYTYTVSKDLFADEGEYKLIVSSKDKADNDAFSDVKDAVVEFVVDRTAPVVTISGLDNDGRYQTESQVVTLIPTDDGGALATLIVNLVDNGGKVVKELVNLAGEELLKALEENDGKIVFEIPEGMYQNVQIICTDMATDAENETNVYDQTITNVTVSSSALKIFWANKPLRWGTIAGVSALLIGGLIVFIFIIKKGKKDK